MSTVSKPRIVYIAGWGRSGSTLLCRALGEIDGWLSVGEVRSVWDLGVLRNSDCGCGEPFHSCPFWRAVFEEAFGGMDEQLARRMIAGMDSIHTWQVLALPRGVLRRRLRARQEAYVANLERLYGALCSISGASVLVDSSKMPGYAVALDAMESFDLRVAHLVRDPRACTFSWMKRRKQQPFGRMKAIGPVRNSVQWVQRNQAIRSTWGSDSLRYRLVRYEDFVADPPAVMASLAALGGDRGADLSFVGPGSVRLGPSHMAAGNPNRFDVGAVDLREDNAWRQGLAARHRTTVRLLSAPWLRSYGYGAS